MTRFRRFSLLSALALGVAFLVPAASAQTSPVDPSAPRILTVTGQESVRIPATLAQISIVIAAQEETSAAASQAVIKPSQAVLAYLKDHDADRIQAGALTLNPIYSRNKASSLRNNESDVVAYAALWNATFTVPADKAGEFAAGVIAAGANRVTRFDFIASDDAINDARTEALQAATRQARDTAEAVLSTLDHRINEVVRIHVNSNGPVRPMQRGMMQMAALESSGGSPAVEPGFIDIEGNVTLEVRY
ncbi:SIMPL domain-containing protein [Synoicihabitans lomoniglobus]|uniref:SIMPL domain-containing protein n=1 Tax=Synoicihabitans lomoniglobus TaxID=2909285 RepID=A0AAF0A0K6_9BACT|nr:SIMPL domain-containing protein [Opitutaceae bacterium LMO-M01]WED65068.1 SIMPL domain-containing protein [Opitutaceae bacterium LMO-M01]